MVLHYYVTQINIYEGKEFSTKKRELVEILALYFVVVSIFDRNIFNPE